MLTHKKVSIKSVFKSVGLSQFLSSLKDSGESTSLCVCCIFPMLLIQVEHVCSAQLFPECHCSSVITTSSSVLGVNGLS